MKRLLFFVLVACALPGWAQPYESISGQTTTEWVFEWSNFSGPFVDTFFIEKDTVLHGVGYKKLAMKRPSQYPTYAVGFLREDTVMGKIWYKGLDLNGGVGTSDTIERLAFNFSLQTGDTFNINPGDHSGNPASWNVVDSVRYVFGRKHIYFRGACDWYDPPPYEPTTFIEGIGSNVSPMYKHRNTFLQAQYTLCTYKDGIRTFYSNRRYNGECALPTSVSDKTVVESLVMVFPNPVGDLLQVKYPVGEKLVSLALYSATGQRIVKRENGISELLVRGLPPGMYLLQINLADKQPLYRRVVLQ